jgi:putative flippase GtrA
LVAFGRYLLSAGAATCVDVALVQLLLAFEFSRMPWLYGAVIAAGATCGMAVNFLVSRRFVFAADQRSAPKQLASFVAVSLTTLLLRLAVAYGLVGLFGLPLFGWINTLPTTAPAERLAHLAAVGLVTVYSFFAHKHISFGGGFQALFSNRSAVRP